MSAQPYQIPDALAVHEAAVERIGSQIAWLDRRLVVALALVDAPREQHARRVLVSAHAARAFHQECVGILLLAQTVLNYPDTLQAPERIEAML